MKARSLVPATVRCLVVLSLLLPHVSAAQENPDAQRVSSARPPLALSPAPEGAALLYRTRVTLRPGRDAARLEKLGVTVLQRFANQAIVLADEGQLEDLARLRFEPNATDGLDTLLAAHPATASWLLAQLTPQLRALAQAADRGERPRLSLSKELAGQVISLASVDDDGDGLTNTQESWWGTEPMNPDSDGDGTGDGAEVSALKDWLGNRRASYPACGRPFLAWPDATHDADYDGVPDLAERWELGLNMNRESTDRDKFDDGQELFGLTHWSWAALPRTEDTGYIFAEMPAWVKSPGNHPLVAAFPVPGVDVVESSLHVQTVTTVTTDHTIGEGVERSYSTSDMAGTSTTTTQTETWNNWQEISKYNYTEAGQASQQNVDATAAGDPLSTLVSVVSLGNTLYKDLIKKEKGITFKDFFGFGIRPGDDNCLVLEEDVPLDLSKLDLENIQVGLGMNQACQLGTGAGVPCFSPWGTVTGGDTSAQLNRSWENYALMPDWTSQEKLTFNSEGSLLVDGKDPSKKESRLCLGQTQVLNIGSAAGPVNVAFQPISSVATTGQSRGGEYSTSHANYQEHTVTNGEAFSSEESWGTATAVDSSHAADLWFTYKVRNSGTEYAREIRNLAFNVYLGDNPDPICTYFVGSVTCGDPGGSTVFANFMPGEEHAYTSHHIPLTLEQMKAIDLGGPLRIVLEDFTYGNDELFYQDAVNAGVWVAIEDGTDDGDEGIDTYLMPTWSDETVQDVIARHFPYEEDADGNMIAIWSPEYRTDTPSWCREGYHLGGTLWCKHALSTADWWNIYLDNLGDGTTALQDTPAASDSTAFFRFNKDSDLDGYSDRSEWRLATDPGDPASHPKPEVIAGVHSIRTGTYVTSTLSLLNTGLYDAYGVEAVMVAPDDSVGITNNTVGGSGRVKAQKQVVVGSRILTPSYDSSTWTGTAKPASGGYFTATHDITYTFTVSCTSPSGCDVGSDAWGLLWSDSDGLTGTLNFGAGYLSPNLLDVGTYGVKVSLLSGKAFGGNAFLVQARTPRDTFQYTINSEPHAEPVVLVSYNDPQGNHRFITPVDLTTPSQDLVPYSGQMLQGLGAEIVTQQPVTTTGSYATDVVVNWPVDVTLANAHLFLEFVDISGTVAAEFPVTVTEMYAGPNVVSIPWSTGVFSPAFQADQDYIVMAFWTDWEGNIIDVAARPLSSFQEDPAPALAMATADETWDFGTAAQGTVMQRQFALASVGFMDLLTYLGETGGVDVSGDPSMDLPPGDMGVYTVTLNTAEMAEGPFVATIDVRTSDAECPTRTITIRGTVTPMAEDAPGGATLRPLDVAVTVTGTHAQGTWVDFSHTLQPDAQSLHPVKVYSQDYATLWGVGKYATPFGNGTVSYDMFGDGRDGNASVPAGSTAVINTVAASATASGTSAMVSTSSGFLVGDLVMFHQTQGTANVGRWELATIDSISGLNWTLAEPLQYTYSSSLGKAQVIAVPQFVNVMVEAGATLTVPAWDGTTGGIMTFAVSGRLTVAGLINAAGIGYRRSSLNHGGASSDCGGNDNYQGEGTAGVGAASVGSNGTGGGGGRSEGSRSNAKNSVGGAGGGNGGAGAWSPSETGTDNPQCGTQGGTAGGGTAGSDDLATMVLGGAGGRGGTSQGGQYSNAGGNGGGIVAVFAREIEVTGGVNLNGANGENVVQHAGGGGGAGGSCLIRVQEATLGANLVTAAGGSGGARDLFGGGGGAGGGGRIRIEYCESLSGSTVPAASAQKLDCYIAEQVESAPYNGARLNLPESFSDGRTYQVQYGRRMVFTGSGTQTPVIRLPKLIYTSASLDALVSNTGVSSGPLTLQIDVGNDGAFDWTQSGTTTFPATLVVSPVVEALNAYLVSQTGVAWGTPIDVPFRVSIDRQADVILTNLVLGQQFNQPEGGGLSVEIGADRPLDWTQVVVGPKNQGDTYTFTHTIGPDTTSIHPCKVYDQSGTTLKGVGKYCSDFGSGTFPYQVFGDGRDGDLTVASGQTAYVDDVRTALSSSASAGQRTVPAATTSGFAAGQEVLVIQVQGTGAGLYEFQTIESVGSGSLTLVQNLANTYAVGGNSRAQVLRVPHYRNVTVQTGGTLTATAWDGSTGGIVAFRASGIVSVDGVLGVSEKGFKGAPGTNPTCGGGNPNLQGESYTGSPSQTHVPNYGGGGGGDNETGHEHGNYAGGGGGGYGTPGTNGQVDPSRNPSAPANDAGMGGSPHGTADLATIFFGSGGGQSGNDWRCPGGGAGYGGNGGGAIIVVAREVDVRGNISADGQGGCATVPYNTGCYGGGGGAGGSVFIRTSTAALGAGRVTASGGLGGYRGWADYRLGGTGGVGRIRIEAQTLSGTTNPAASTQQVYFYVTEQVNESPWTLTRFYLPEPIATTQTYLIQYARRFQFDVAGQQSSFLRLRRQMYGSASLDALVSNTGVSSGKLYLCLDIGNDGTCDHTHNASTTFPATITMGSLASAVNAYIQAHTEVLWGQPIDVPVRVQVDRQAQVMLTNLALKPVGAKTRFVRRPARQYSSVTLDLEFGTAGDAPGALAFTVDVGAEGTVDWSDADSGSFPLGFTSPNLAGDFNAYLSGLSGEVDVPIRIVPSPYLATNLDGFSAIPSALPDAGVGVSDLDAGPSTPTEGDTVPVTVTVHNTTTVDCGPLVASFFASAPDWGDWYIGSAFVPGVPAMDTNEGSIDWNTLGFTSAVPVRVVLDPYDRVHELNELNNETALTVTLRTRPDLHVTTVALSDYEPLAGETVTVTLTVRNAGQSDAGDAVFALYDGNPDDGGAELGNQTVPLPGGGESELAFLWTPVTPGPYRLFTASDRDGAVWEYDEGNNQTWLDIYVGLPGPLELDCAAGSDVAYTPSLGYGYMDERQPDQLVTCGAEAYKTLRKDVNGRVLYRFDHLQRGHFYHLDLSLFECDSVGRRESVYIDGLSMAGPIYLGDQQVHRLSLRVDPALYADRTISVTVEAPGLDGAVVSELALHDITYRYADAGASGDLPYSAGRGFGWLDGSPITSTLTLPYQTARVETLDNELRYRFDRLDPAKRYQVNLSFWQQTGDMRRQKIQIDGQTDPLDVGTMVDVESGRLYEITVPVLESYYQGDGSIVVGILRTNAKTGAMVCEVALEEMSLVTEAPCDVPETPSFSEAYGTVTLNEQPAPAGTLIEALNPRGEVVGCFLVRSSGYYGLMRIYGEDTTASPPIAGMRKDEVVAFRVNGALAVATPLFYWQDDWSPHRADLSAFSLTSQAIWLASGWNLISMNVKPPVPLVNQVLDSITGKYDRLLGEHGIHIPTLPITYSTLSELGPGLGYYLRVTETAGINLLLEGVPQVVTTPLALHEGWNWIGYLPGITLPITMALQSIDGSYLRVLSLRQSYDPALPEFSWLREMGPGDGYLIRTTGAVTLTYPPEGGSGLALGPARTTPTGALPPATPYFSLAYGRVTINARPAPTGTRVEVLTPRGEVAGSFTVQQGGYYGLVHVYGLDETAAVPIPGFRPDEPLRFRVNGFAATPSTTVLWQDDKEPHQVNLGLDVPQLFLPLLGVCRE